MIWDFLTGGVVGREQEATRTAFHEAERQWRRSPLGSLDLNLYAVDLIKEVVANAGRSPAMPILYALYESTMVLLTDEPISPIEVDWRLVESNVSVGVAFRKEMARRQRWASQYQQFQEVFRKPLSTAFERLISRLPESCFADWDNDRAGNTVEVPLVDVLEDPAQTIKDLISIPYDPKALDLGLFASYRGTIQRNLLVASGFHPTDELGKHVHKLVYPDRQKDKSAGELSDLYLAGSPFANLANVPVPFIVPEQLRFEHCHIIGGTGHGKTQLMQKLIHADLLASQKDFRSVIVVDSQGDLINKLVRLEIFSPDAPDSLSERLVVIDPSDVEFPAALNLFDAHLERVRDYNAADRERVLNGVIELYELFFGAFLGAELTQKQGVIFKYLARLMLVIPNASIQTLMQIMEDGRPYKQYIDQLDGSARYFFETEFFHPSFTATKKQVLRRLWGVLSTPAFERMFTQTKNKLDLFEAMNEGKIILVNTAKDLLKREGSQLLGRFFIAMITQAALERATIPEYRRNSSFVYVDEAQEYFDDSIETILNQARKYRVGLTLAHQTLDQLSVRLRSALLANTSMKCAGGVSAKDARGLADELRTTSDFIEGMRRRGERTEFAVWIKHLTGQAIRLSVPLGFLERQPALAEEEYDQLIAENRLRYCGTLADVGSFKRISTSREETPGKSVSEDAVAPPDNHEGSVLNQSRDPGLRKPPDSERSREPSRVAPREEPAVEFRELGKGGAKHRYLQSLTKELAETHGLKATIEAPLPNGGQVDVLIERDGILAAVEISISTPVEHERENLRKCLTAKIPRIAVVLVKSRVSQSNYRASLAEVVPEMDRGRVAFLTPEELPDFIAGIAPRPEASERIVRGYRVKTSLGSTSPEDARAKREALARLIAKSMSKRD